MPRCRCPAVTWMSSSCRWSPGDRHVMLVRARARRRNRAQRDCWPGRGQPPRLVRGSGGRHGHGTPWACPGPRQAQRGRRGGWRGDGDRGRGGGHRPVLGVLELLPSTVQLTRPLSGQFWPALVALEQLATGPAQASSNNSRLLRGEKPVGGEDLLVGDRTDQLLELDAGRSGQPQDAGRRSGPLSRWSRRGDRLAAHDRRRAMVGRYPRHAAAWLPPRTGCTLRDAADVPRCCRTAGSARPGHQPSASTTEPATPPLELVLFMLTERDRVVGELAGQLQAASKFLSTWSSLARAPGPGQPPSAILPGTRTAQDRPGRVRGRRSRWCCWWTRRSTRSPRARRGADCDCYSCGLGRPGRVGPRPQGHVGAGPRGSSVGAGSSGAVSPSVTHWARGVPRSDSLGTRATTRATARYQRPLVLVAFMLRSSAGCSSTRHHAGHALGRRSAPSSATQLDRAASGATRATITSRASSPLALLAHGLDRSIGRRRWADLGEHAGPVGDVECDVTGSASRRWQRGKLRARRTRPARGPGDLVARHCDEVAEYCAGGRHAAPALKNISRPLPRPRRRPRRSLARTLASG